MAVTAYPLASGCGWRVDDIVCDAGPRARPYEEQHEGACIALVTEGTFQYRTARGSALLIPGAMLLGNSCESFRCSHEHGTGDRCLSFHYTPELLETIVSAIPGVRRMSFAVPRLAPSASLMPLACAAEAARADPDASALEELALQIAGAAAAALAGVHRPVRAASPREERAVTRALRCIEAEAHGPLPLQQLAREAAMSPYHFLRTFSRVAGMTPHQYVLRTRLHRAAVQLRASTAPISRIALDAGFSDVSTFNRRFRRLLNASPGTYRHGRGGPATAATR